MTAVIPRIINIFKILLPTIFPIVIPALLSNAAVMLTAASGKLVPMATIVSPITSCGIPSFFAILAAPSTNQSAPFTSRKNPTSKINICTIILPTSFLFICSRYKKRDSYCIAVKVSLFHHFPSYFLITVLTKKCTYFGQLLPFIGFILPKSFSKVNYIFFMNVKLLS